ncbi:MAG: response regulator [Gemmatimonadota bacterium]|jgi:putative two-component system response regulator
MTARPTPVAYRYGGDGLPGTGRVLVVDDDPTLARTLARILEREGLQCETAFSAHEAIRRLSPATDLVLCDVYMPDGSGLDLTRQVKERDNLTQVVVMTGYAEIETVVQALRMEADDFLAKPVERAHLVHAVRRALEHRRLLLEERDYQLRLEDRLREQSDRLTRLYVSSIHSLVTALEARDPYTRGHSDRVADYAVAIGKRLDFRELNSLETGSKLHDIGKIGTHDRVLGKTGPLTDEEREEIEAHTRVGTRILSGLLGDRIVLDIVAYHHERWDGAGYPEGLRGEVIPLAARIVAVADTMDAMTTERPYRPARSWSDTAQELARQSGVQFDAEIAQAAIQLIADHDFEHASANPDS